MLLCCRLHHEYQNFLRQQILVLYAANPKRLISFSKPLTKLWLLDLDPVIPLFLPLFPDLGRPVVHDPVDLLRSLILMSDQKVSGITAWVEKLRSDNFLATLSGFDPDKTPGVGTFYDFLDRLWLESKFSQQRRRLALRLLIRKPAKKLKNGQKLKVKRPQVVNRLVSQITSDRNLFPRRPAGAPWALIQDIFGRCFVDRSTELALIPDPLALVLSGDGSSVRTGASPHGIKVCDCRKSGVFNCKCKRRFTDPEARWGWDSYRNEYFYGYMLYELTSATSHNDLPVYLRFAQGNRHDSVMGVVSIAEFKQIYPGLNITKFLGDSAHDAYAFYELLAHKNIEPFIDLNPRTKKVAVNIQPVKVNDSGIPVCPAGSPMIFWGIQKERKRLKWRCPKVAGSKLVKSQVCCSKSCSPSAYGRTVYTKPGNDLRLFTPTPRGSAAWKKTYKMRSSSERSFSRKKKDYNLEQCRVRSLKAWYWRAHFAAMNQHLDAWVKHLAKDQAFDVWSEILGSVKMTT